MPPRPLHRWKSFWLGVFVNLFLLPWTTWLVGRSRRMKRLAHGTAGPQTGSNGS